MGYRLEFYNPNQHDEFVPDCGGKLFGYIEDEELEKCKSWQWLKANGFFMHKSYTWKDNGNGAKERYTRVDREHYDETYAYSWTYGFDHKMYLSHDKFKEFITLYIEDWNTYRRPQTNCEEMTIDEYAYTLSLDVVECVWF